MSTETKTEVLSSQPAGGSMSPAQTRAEHTPGPWKVYHGQPHIWANDGKTKVATVADLPWIDGKSDWITEEANATLIAAAPELLEMVKEISRIFAFPGFLDSHGFGSRLNALITKASAGQEVNQ